MRTFLFICLFALSSSLCFSQSKIINDRSTSKGSLYVYWGWNWDKYTNSDIHFQGDDYDFTLKKVIAKDRQSEFGLEPYFNPLKITIPQYNFRIGYFFKDNWDISWGVDHMKYVVKQYQISKISGYINNQQSNYDGIYQNDDISVAEDFLKFEHTDGLNYVNLEISHSNNLYEKGIMKICLREGFGAGIMTPKTNTTLLGKQRYDEFHLAGYGISAHAGINATFLDKYFIQTNLKGGFINLPDVRTTLSKTDKADHNFLFSEFMLVFGATIRAKDKKIP